MTGPPLESTGEAPALAARPSRWRKWLKRSGILLLLAATIAVGYFWWNRRHPQAPTEIYQGITYGCERLETTAEGSGLVHWVRVDLTAPGISLYVTPLEPAAVRAGWQYQLARPAEVLEREGLAVVINGSLFSCDSGWYRQSGDLARSVETVVSDHEVSHVWEHTYLLWFDDQLTPHLKPSKPPTAADLALAKWGIGGQGIGLQEGKVRAPAGEEPKSRTAVAIDRERKLLFLAIAESATPRLLLAKLADLGAKDGMVLDGGGSTSMVLGPDAHTVRPGRLHNGWRPVATCFGVRARPVPNMQ
jgi:Phosphodiester glycosidase